ncbi:MAG: flagellar hook protein FlgE [Bacteriovoracaceae bacterium]|nr:flagellar hook protein FlgE [Bacteriovoracaceae bacterium]
MKFFAAILIVSSFLLAGCGSSSDTLNKSENQNLSNDSKSSVEGSSQPLADFSEGKIVSTNRTLDLVIRGHGFFIVNSASGEKYFTRSGSFIKDSLGTGVLTTRDGYYLQGYAIDEKGKVAAKLSNIQVTTLGLDSKARATTILHYSVNLDASQNTAGGPFDGSTLTNAALTSQFNVSQTAYDSVGNAHEIHTFFRKVAANTWSYHVLTEGSNLANYAAVAGGSAILQDGILIFDSAGSLTDVTAETTFRVPSHLNESGILAAGDLINPELGNPAGYIQWKGGSPIAEINYDFGQMSGSTSRTTQFGISSAAELLAQDGRNSGNLMGFSINKNGRISAFFANGVTQDIYEIPLALFPNEERLSLVQNSKDIYAENQISGSASIAESRSSGRGWIQSFAIEQKDTPKSSASDLNANLPDFSQGAFVNTTQPTDLAIQGSGFFAVNEPLSGSTYFTRAGAFVRDLAGQLVMQQSGYTLQGYAIDEEGKVATKLTNVQVTTLGLASKPIATTTIHYLLNLDASQPIAAVAFETTSFTQAAATSNFNTAIMVYDSLGNSRSVVTFFRKEAINSWSYHVLTMGTNLINYVGTPGGAVVLAEGTMTFNTSGSLVGVAPHHYSALDLDAQLVAGEMINPALAGFRSEIQWANGAAIVREMAYDFGQISQGTFSSTQFSAPLSVIVSSQNGRTAGYITSININPNGHISATFTNGSTRDIYEIPLATFPNDEGLKLLEDSKNIYSQSLASGRASIGEAATFDRGEIRSFSLEQKD